MKLIIIMLSATLSISAFAQTKKELKEEVKALKERIQTEIAGTKISTEIADQERVINNISDVISSNFKSRYEASELSEQKLLDVMNLIRGLVGSTYRWCSKNKSLEVAPIYASRDTLETKLFLIQSIISDAKLSEFIKNLSVAGLNTCYSNNASTLDQIQKQVCSKDI